jgi:hypothetical protein
MMGRNREWNIGRVLSCDLPGQSAPSDFPRRRGPGIPFGSRLEEFRQRYAFEIYTYVRLHRDFIDLACCILRTRQIATAIIGNIGQGHYNNAI